MLSNLEEDREDVDYDFHTKLSLKDAENCLKDAETFIKECKRFL